MTSGNALLRSIVPALLAVLILSGTASPAPDPDQLIARLAKPAPASIAFREVRFSPLLQEPLIVAGNLGYTGPANLDRQVLQPYRETTEIRGESVRVAREGEPQRSFALNRAPELRGLLNGFTALLAGDAAAIKRSFSIGTSSTGNAWTLELTPLQAKARRRLRQIVVTGEADEPRCFTLLNTDGGASFLLLGEAAGIELPQLVTVDSVQQLCRPE
jgi:Outer membrane lipoprotein carrier protein LolA-like